MCVAKICESCNVDNPNPEFVILSSVVGHIASIAVWVVWMCLKSSVLRCFVYGDSWTTDINLVC